MKLIYSIFVVVTISMSIAESRLQNYGETCNYKYKCQSEFECNENGVCKCPASHVWSIQSKCFPIIKLPNYDCANCTSLNGTCYDDASACVCPGLYKHENCLSDRRIPCERDNDCQVYSDTLKCNDDRRCGCSYGNQFNHRLAECRPMDEMACYRDRDCQDSDKSRYCHSTSKQCKCMDGYYEDKVQYSNTLKCLKKKEISHECESTDECRPVNSICRHEKSSSSKKCLCKQTFVSMLAQTECKPKFCISDDYCFDNDYDNHHFSCNDYKHQCKCANGFYLNDTTGRCTHNTNKSALNDDCASSKCIIPDSLCIFNLNKGASVCTCKQTYEESDHKCVRKSCAIDSDCDFYDGTSWNRYATCSFLKCKCKAGLVAGVCLESHSDYNRSNSGLNFLWILVLIPALVVLIIAIYRIRRIWKNERAGTVWVRPSRPQPAPDSRNLAHQNPAFASSTTTLYVNVNPNPNPAAVSQNGLPGYDPHQTPHPQHYDPPPSYNQAVAGQRF